MLATLSPSVCHNELFSVQPPSRVLLPCRHSVALNHPKVYKKMWVSWETWILPQLSLSQFFSPHLSFFVSWHLVPLPVLPSLSLTPLSPLPVFPSAFFFSLSPLLSSPLSSKCSQWWWWRFSVSGGNPCRVSVSFSHLSFCARALVFVEHSIVANIQWVKNPLLLLSSSAACFPYYRMLLFNMFVQVLHRLKNRVSVCFLFFISNLRCVFLH